MIKRRRYLISAAALAACVCAALGVLAMLPPQLGVTKANLDRVQIGMNLDEVKAIFDDEPSGVFYLISRNRRPTHTYRALWGGPSGSVTITFKDEVVNAKEWAPSTETISDKLRRWLHLPK